MAITTQDIEQVLERDIRPILASHHGNVVLQDFTDGKVYIQWLSVGDDYDGRNRCRTAESGVPGNRRCHP